MILQNTVPYCPSPAVLEYLFAQLCALSMILQNTVPYCFGVSFGYSVIKLRVLLAQVCAAYHDGCIRARPTLSGGAKAGAEMAEGGGADIRRRGRFYEGRTGG